jgi:hypothetical protein
VLLLAGVIEAKTSIKLLRRLGITLIALPEPVTTPFGVALIFISRYLSRRLEASQNNRLRETVKYYLAHTRRFSDDAYGTSSTQGPVKRHSLSDEHAILGQIAGSRSFAANPSVRQGRRDIQGGTANYTRDMQSLSRRYKAGNSFSNTSARTEKVIYHTINVEWLSRRYESEDSTAVHSNWPRTSGVVKGAMRHSINMGLLSQRYKTGSVGQAKVKSHAINEALILQRYGSASYTTTLNAIRDNNYYYDVLSRKNVIGGYQCSTATNADLSVGTLKKGKNTRGERRNYLRYRYAFLNI